MSSYMIMPKDYAKRLMQQGQRDKAAAFLQYMFSLDEKKNNSIGFYALSWSKSKSTTHAWVLEFREEIAKHFDFWATQNELKYRTLAERQPNDFQKKSNARSTENTGLQPIVPNALPNDNRTPAEQSINNKYKNTKNTKEKNTKKEIVELPTWLDQTVWREWVSYRDEIGKPLANATIKAQLKILEQHQFEQVEIINQSIQCGWNGLFEIKKTKAQNNLAQRNAEAMVQYASLYQNQEEVVNAEIA